MKLPSLCYSLCVLLATAFTFASISSQAETRCPGDIADLGPRVVAGALLVVAAKNAIVTGRFEVTATMAWANRLPGKLGTLICAFSALIATGEPIVRHLIAHRRADAFETVFFILAFLPTPCVLLMKTDALKTTAASSQ